MAAAGDGHTLHTRICIRLATTSDIPLIHRLIHQLAVYENLTHQSQATPAALPATLFPIATGAAPPPSTMLLLELFAAPFPPSHDSHFAPLLKSLPLDLPDQEIFRCGGATMGGFVLFFPNYSTFLAKPGFYVQNIFVRECYRRKLWCTGSPLWRPFSCRDVSGTGTRRGRLGFVPKMFLRRKGMGRLLLAARAAKTGQEGGVGGGGLECGGDFVL
ncbi:hypothetical protein OROHE_010084 [Orobanche hederae]